MQSLALKLRLRVAIDRESRMLKLLAPRLTVHDAAVVPLARDHDMPVSSRNDLSRSVPIAIG